MSLDHITAHLPYQLSIRYLTINDYNSYARVSRLFNRLSKEILEKEAVFFGGTRENSFRYLKALCLIINSKKFPVLTTRVKRPTPDQPSNLTICVTDFRANLNWIKTVSLRKCYRLFCLYDYEIIYPIVSLSPLHVGRIKKGKWLYPFSILMAENGGVKILQNLAERGLIRDHLQCLVKSIESHNLPIFNQLLPLVENVSFDTLEGTPLFIAERSLQTAQRELEWFPHDIELQETVKNAETIIKILIENDAKPFSAVSRTIHNVIKQLKN